MAKSKNQRRAEVIERRLKDGTSKARIALDLAISRPTLDKIIEDFGLSDLYVK